MLKYQELKNHHVFTGGTAKSRGITAEDVELIVNNYHELKEAEGSRLVPCIKLSHADGEEQAKMAAQLGVLGFGHVSDARSEGAKLYVDMDVPEMIFDAVGSGELSGQPSVEIMKDYVDADGVSHGPTLRAVAFLIGTQPGIPGLEGLAAYSDHPENGYAYFEDGQDVDIITTERDVMKPKDIVKFGELAEGIAVQDLMDKVYELHWAFMDKVREVVDDNDMDYDQKNQKMKDLGQEYSTMLMEKLQEGVDKDNKPAVDEFCEQNAELFLTQAQKCLTESEKKGKIVEKTQKYSDEQIAAILADNKALKDKANHNRLTAMKDRLGKVFVPVVAEKFSDVFSAMLSGVETMHFSDDDKKDMSVTDAFESVIEFAEEQAGKDALLNPEGSESQENLDDAEGPIESYDDDGEKEDREIQKYSDEHNVSYSEAVRIVRGEKKKKTSV